MRPDSVAENGHLVAQLEQQTESIGKFLLQQRQTSLFFVLQHHRVFVFFRLKVKKIEKQTIVFGFIALLNF